MKAGYAEVVENERVYGNVYAMWLRAPELAHGAYPGQFVMLRCSDDAAYADGDGRGGEGHADDPLLPRPMSYYRVRDGADGPEWAVLYDVAGRGTGWLARRRPGDRLYGWGPLGNGFKVGRTSRNLLLVAGGIGVAPLVRLPRHADRRGVAPP